MNTGVVMVDFVGDKIGGSLDEQAAELRTVGYRETTARYEPEGPAAD